MITDKRNQRNDWFKMVVAELEGIKSRAAQDGKLDSNDIDEASKVVEDSLKDIKEYTSVILNQIDMLKRLVHAELRKEDGEGTVCRGGPHWHVQN